MLDDENRVIGKIFPDFVSIAQKTRRAPIILPACFTANTCSNMCKSLSQVFEVKKLDISDAAAYHHRSVLSWSVFVTFRVDFGLVTI